MMPLLGIIAEIKKFLRITKDQSMELTRNERGVHLHTFEDRDAEALQERGRWSRTRSDSDRGRIRSKHRTTAPPRSTHVQPGDVSYALIQQGEKERLGKTPSSSTTAWRWMQQNSGRASPSCYGRRTRCSRGREAPRLGVPLPSPLPSFI